MRAELFRIDRQSPSAMISDNGNCDDQPEFESGGKQRPARDPAIVQVAVPVPLFSVFDYLWPTDIDFRPGMRVRIRFGKRTLVGVTLRQITKSDVPPNRLREVLEVLDTEPVFDASMLRLFGWLSEYYHHPVGEVLQLALPAALRKGKPAELRPQSFWVPKDLVPSVRDAARKRLQRAPLRARLYEEIAAAPEGLPGSQLRLISPRWRQSVAALEALDLVQRQERSSIQWNKAETEGPTLHDEQQVACRDIAAALGSFAPFLLFGVTGSGKTEVYLQSILSAVAAGSQVLVLVPEISLTPQLLARFRQRLDARLVVLHSAMNDSERLEGWLAVSRGEADVVIGTRSAALLPMPRLGLIIVDEEHDGSYKQQDSLRYHARDLAILRAKERCCPVVLGSATPSLETLHNVETGRYRQLMLRQRAGGAEAPSISLLDIRRQTLVEGLSEQLLADIQRSLEAGGQAMVFINRRGFAPTLLCNDCGQPADCRRCDAHMTVHARSARLRCHHCGSERTLPLCCEHCGSEALDRVGQGTERIAAALEERFPDIEIARIDRDSTRRKGELDRQLERAFRGEARILVGTQMLAKGHHFPGLTLVGILDADRGLFGTDFRSLEHMAQLILQVAGRAGRAESPGKVILQTRNPEHPMLGLLVREGYGTLARAMLEERQNAELPPFSFLAVIRAEAVSADAASRFLSQVSEHLKTIEAAHAGQSDYEICLVLGPAPAPMERLGGRYRAQLLLQAPRRSLLQSRLASLVRIIPNLPAARQARWSVDVDPVILF